MYVGACVATCRLRVLTLRYFFELYDTRRSESYPKNNFDKNKERYDT